MILYRLRCSKGHEFESWFKDSKSYERQEKKSPESAVAVCGDSKVARARHVSAPSAGESTRPAGKGDGRGRSRRRPLRRLRRPARNGKQMAALAKHMPKEMRETLLKLREQVEKNCEHVGPKFAEEARQDPLRRESDKRGIYGRDLRRRGPRRLAEEGIEFGRLPWVPRGN